MAWVEMSKGAKTLGVWGSLQEVAITNHLAEIEIHRKWLPPNTLNL